jgi:hypothetical protein
MNTEVCIDHVADVITERDLMEPPPMATLRRSISRLIATTVARAVWGKPGGSRPLQLGGGKNLVAFPGSLCSFKKNLGKKAEDEDIAAMWTEGFVA